MLYTNKNILNHTALFYTKILGNCAGKMLDFIQLNSSKI